MNSYGSIVIAAVLISAFVVVGILAMSRPICFIFWGFVAPCILSLCGLGLLARGVRGNTRDESEIPSASRAWFIIGGALLQVPLIGYTLFVWKQGFFGQ